MDKTLDIFNFKAVELLEHLGYFLPDQKAIDIVEQFLRNNQSLSKKQNLFDENKGGSNQSEIHLN